MSTVGGPFEIRVDGVVRTHRDVRGSAIEAARFLKQRNPGAKIVITDLRDGSNVPFDHPSEHWLHGFNYNVEEWFEGDRYETRQLRLVRLAWAYGALELPQALVDCVH